MKPSTLSCSLALGLLACLSTLTACSSADATTSLQVNAEALAPDLPRYGLNLGGAGTWGAEQLRANVLANPGFEPILDRAIVVVGQSGARQFADDTDWLARPEGFWSGATYDVRSGTASGQQGRILDSRRKTGKGADTFSSDTDLHDLRAGDVVALTRDVDTTIAPHWWKGQGRVASSTDVAPGSTGRQSLRLLALPGQPAQILHYLDNLSERAGKLLPVHGKWKLSLWARQASPNASLTLRFDRSGRPAFLETPLTPTAEWKRFEFEFETQDQGPAGVLTLGITALQGEVLIDDVYLGEAEPGPGGFRQVVVQTLRELHPGYLRDWQGQLGDTLANRLSGEFGHRPARYRPGDNESQFHYNLPDFLALCAAVKAQPWVSAPTTLSDQEWKKLGAYLRTAADQFGFAEIFVEFGNENWNIMFRPGGIPNPVTLGKVADRGFGLMREGAGHDKRLRTILNAQFVNPDSPKQVGQHSRQADRISVAPYFLYQLDAAMSVQDGLKAAFSDDSALMAQEVDAARQQGKQLSVYEVNFHTTGGSASREQRDLVTASGASGTALARRLLQASLAGVREQAVYSLAGFDSHVDGSKNFVRLWGITRDLSVPHRLRPTGLALTMLNRVAGGPAHALACNGKACPTLTSLAFGGGRSLAIASASPQALPLQVTLPCPSETPYTLRLLDGSNPQLNNEAQMQVAVSEQQLVCQNNQLAFTLAPYSLVTLAPATKP